MYLQIQTIRNPWNFQRKCGGKAMLRGGGVLQAQLVVFTLVLRGPLMLFVPDYSNYSWMHDNQARFQFTSMRDREISEIQVDGVDDGSDWQRRIGCSVFIVVSKQEKSILFRTKSLGTESWLRFRAKTCLYSDLFHAGLFHLNKPTEKRRDIFAWDILRNPPLTCAQSMSQSTLAETCLSQGSPCISSCWSRSGPRVVLNATCRVALNTLASWGNLHYFDTYRILQTWFLRSQDQWFYLILSAFSTHGKWFVPICDVMVWWYGKSR